MTALEIKVLRIRSLKMENDDVKPLPASLAAILRAEIAKGNELTQRLDQRFLTLKAIGLWADANGLEPRLLDESKDTWLLDRIEPHYEWTFTLGRVVGFFIRQDAKFLDGKYLAAEVVSIENERCRNEVLMAALEELLAVWRELSKSEALHLSNTKDQPI